MLRRLAPLPALQLLLLASLAAAQAPPGYIPLPQLTDEFNTDGTLDASKWRASDEGWQGPVPDPATLPDQPFLVDYVRSFAPPPQ